jgi:isoleucyl-tRNA synthetase
VVIANSQFISDLDSLKNYVQEELNIRDVILTTDEQQYGISLEAKVDWPTLGKKLKKDVQIVRKALPSLSQDQLRAYQRDKKTTIQNIELGENDLTIVRIMTKDATATAVRSGPEWEPAFSDDAVVLLDAAPHPELVDEGLARELINRVQRLRKKAGLVPTDDIRMGYTVVSNPEALDVDDVVSSRRELFEGALRGMLEKTSEQETEDKVILEEDNVVGDLTLRLRLFKT